jgi:hypothetical protein
VQEVRWDKGGTEPEGQYTLCMEREMKIMNYVQASAIKKVKSVSDKMPYRILRDCWCDIIVLKVHAPTEDKINDMKDSYYEELYCVFDKFPK